MAQRFRLPYQIAVADSREGDASWHALEPLLASWQLAAHGSRGDRAGAEPVVQ
jgi:hypothetical protein